MNRLTDKHMRRWANKQMSRWKDEQMSRWTNILWVGRGTDEQTDRLTVRQMVTTKREADRRMCRWAAEQRHKRAVEQIMRMSKQLEEQMNTWADEQRKAHSWANVRSHLYSYKFISIVIQILIIKILITWFSELKNVQYTDLSIHNDSNYIILYRMWPAFSGVRTIP